MLSLLLFSCHQEKKLAEERKALLAKDEKSFLAAREESRNVSLFSASLLYEENNDGFSYLLTLDSFKNIEHDVRTLIKTEEGSIYYFGYEASYTLVPEKEESKREKNIVKGLRIGFSQKKKETSFPVYYLSSEHPEGIYFLIPAEKK